MPWLQERASARPKAEASPPFATARCCHAGVERYEDKRHDKLLRDLEDKGHHLTQMEMENRRLKEAKYEKKHRKHRDAETDFVEALFKERQLFGTKK